MSTAGKKEKIQKAGSFHIQQAEIITSRGMVVDLLGCLMHVTFFSDLQSSSITGNCLINDMLDISTLGPIIGQEYLRMKIKTQGLNEDESTINFTENLLVVNSLVYQEPGASGNKFLTLEFSTSELQKDQRIRINQSYSGSYSDIFKKIMRDHLSSKKKLYVEPSRGTKKLVFPNFTPFEAIDMMKRQAVSAHDGSPTYMFFEDFKGYHFRSLSSMYSEPTVFTYKTSVPGSKPNDPISDLSTVIDFDVQSIGDSLAAQRLGSFGSELITYDTYTRRSVTTIYNYLDNFKNEIHVTRGRETNKDEFPLISSTPVQGTSRMSDFHAKRYLVPNANYVDNDGNYTDLTVLHDENGIPVYNATQTETWLQRRESQLLQLDRGITCTIRTNGNTLIDCGDVVEFNLPVVSSAKTDQNDKLDFFYKDRFLIKTIRQDFSVAEKKHESIMTLVKDSLPEELLSVDESLEFEPEDNDEIIEEFYVKQN